MKYPKYKEVAEGIVEVSFEGDRNVMVIMHECGELDFEGDYNKLSEKEQDDLYNWVCENFECEE